MSKVYLASGWFTQHTEEMVSFLEDYLPSIGLQIYSPRRDGIKLEPNQLHDSEVRKAVFNDNVKNIIKADFLVVNVDGTDGHLDTGTIWEAGYAAAMGIPMIGIETGDNGGVKLLGGTAKSYQFIAHSYEELKNYITNNLSFLTHGKVPEYPVRTANVNNRLLVVGPDNEKFNQATVLDLSTSITGMPVNMKCRAVDHSAGDHLVEYIDDMFEDVDAMLAVIDDRHPVVSWMMGQAYARNVPTVSYTEFNYGVNLMLLVSIKRHCKGLKELRTLLDDGKKEGFANLVTPDYSNIKAI